jgi:hypothetical protein
MAPFAARSGGQFNRGPCCQIGGAPAPLHYESQATAYMHVPSPKILTYRISARHKTPSCSIEHTNQFTQQPIHLVTLHTCMYMTLYTLIIFILISCSFFCQTQPNIGQQLPYFYVLLSYTFSIHYTRIGNPCQLHSFS